MGKPRSAVQSPAGLAQPGDRLLDCCLSPPPMALRLAEAELTGYGLTHLPAQGKPTVLWLRRNLSFSGCEPECVQTSITTSEDVCLSVQNCSLKPEIQR